MRILEDLVKKAKNVVGRTALAGTVAAASYFGFPNPVHSDVVVKTRITDGTNQVTNLVADGQTEYTLEVTADTMEHPGTMFNGVDWNVVIPTNVTVYDAELPDPTAPVSGPSTNPNDFFYPQGSFNGLMQSSFNYVSGGPYPFSGGELTGNSRVTLSTSTGPSNCEDLVLGVYRFVANPGFIGTDNFDVNGVSITDTSWNEYNTPDYGEGVRVENQVYNGVSPIIMGDIDGNGTVDGNDAYLLTQGLLGKLENTEQMARTDLNNDGSTNGNDISYMVDALLNN